MSDVSPLVIDYSAFPEPHVDLPSRSSEGGAHAVLAGGCFWCTEAVYRAVEGVIDVVAGYTGGTSETANYRDVCSGRTGHAEAIRVTFDPSKTTFGQILKLFFSIAHDPTQPDGQGSDLGAQYRSAIFFADEEQRRIAELYIAQLNEATVFRRPIATTLEPLLEFFEAEEAHQNYAARNPSQPYIRAVALPKVEKLRKHMPTVVAKV